MEQVKEHRITQVTAYSSQRGCAQALREGGYAGCLPRFTSWLCCQLEQAEPLLENTRAEEEFPRGNVPDNLGTTWFGGESQRCKGVLEANRTTIVLPV